MAINPTSGRWRLLRNNTQQVEFVNNSGGTLEAGELVVVSGGSFGGAVDNNTVGAHGVVADDVANGAKGALLLDGEFLVGVNGTVDFDIDDPVYSSTNGLVDDGTTGDVEVGRIAPHENPPSGQASVRVLLRSLFIVTDLFTHA